jgi:Tol biopolymer transport system component/DNA-binding winged helix-turn-helix (wHTH) protein
MAVTSSGIYEFGPFRLDLEQRLLTRSGQVLPLAPKTFDLLVLLAQRPRHAFSKQELISALWPDTFVEEANLSFQISTLRKALSDGEAQWIETIPKHGYRFSADVRTITVGSAVEKETDPANQSAPKTANSTPAAIGAGRVAERARNPQLWVGGTLLVALIIVLAMWLQTWTRERPGPPILESPLTAYEGFETEPAFSPDGNQVVYVWNRDGANSDLYVGLIGTVRAVPLTNTPEQEFSPAWSPDGLSIAFLRREFQKASLFVIPSSGGEERNIAESGPDGVIDGTVRWAPDGKHLLVSGTTTENDHRIGLLLIDRSTGEKRRLTSPPGPAVDWGGSFSPDGRQIGFLRQLSNQTLQGNIHVLNIDASFQPTGEARPLKTDGLQMGAPAWTADGKELVFRSFREGMDGLWRVNVAGGTPVRIPVAGSAPSEPTLRGKRLAYVQRVSDPNIWAIRTSGTREAVPLVASTRVDAGPQYSPDGSRIAFCSEQSGSQEIWVARSDGSRQEKLTSFGSGQSCTPRWSPDSLQLVFDSNAEAAQFEIYTMNADGGRLRRLTHHPGTDAIPSFSRDGQWIYFMSTRTGREEIWKMPAAGGKPLQVTTTGGLVAFESHNGDMLLFTKPGDGPLWQIPVGGGAEIKVFENAVARRSFVPAEDGIYFAQRTDQGYSFQFFNFATRQVRPFRSTPLEIANGVTVSPDRRWLAYAQRDREGSDIVVVENFR